MLTGIFYFSSDDYTPLETFFHGKLDYLSKIIFESKIIVSLSHLFKKHATIKRHLKIMRNFNDE